MRCWIYTPSLREQWKFYVKYWQVCSGRRLTDVLWVSQPSSSGNSWSSGHCISGWEPGWQGQQDCLQHLVPWLHTICFQQAKDVALPVWALTGVRFKFYKGWSCRYAFANASLEFSIMAEEKRANLLSQSWLGLLWRVSAPFSVA